ncbi:riboflavin biosynthesis protein RibBA [Gordonia polyisoprenivorans NBRC 16320 = JCM 10675]|nr:riboflavin biosynthesis protein RibBA [Gordonia polyisoprenivorans NBRC 16320 = JCM 10675]
MCSASYVTAVTAAFLVRYSSGYLEVALPNTECVRLGLSSMSGVAVAAQNGTGYTVTVDAASGIGTGISAGDRATTMRRLADPASTAASFTRPGHVQPRVTGAGGSRSRPDYAHAAVDLAGIAQLSPVCGIGHLVSADNPHELADAAEAQRFASHHGLSVVDVRDVAECMAERTQISVGPAFSLTTRHGDFNAVTYSLLGQPDEYTVLSFGAGPSAGGCPYIHHACLGQLLLAERCDCADRLDRAMAAIVEVGHGTVVLVRHLLAPNSCVAPRTAGADDAVREAISTARRLLSQLPLIDPDYPTHDLEPRTAMIA